MTRLCRNWVQSGQCAYEDVCCFAHGESELRDPAANLKVPPHPHPHFPFAQYPPPLCTLAPATSSTSPPECKVSTKRRRSALLLAAAAEAPMEICRGRGGQGQTGAV